MQNLDLSNTLANISILTEQRNVAQKQLDDAIKAVRDQLPKGIELVIDEEMLGSKTGNWERVLDKRYLKVGDVVRVNPENPGPGTRVDSLPSGMTFTVTRIDSCEDRHLDFDDFDMCNRYSNFQKRVS